ncbi:MAG: SDR family NAD(P)-dependent oxidoreductase [Kiritimatiellia bacterium]
MLRNLLAVNLESALVLLRVLLGKRTNPAAFAAAVFVSSTYGIRGGKGMSAYSASKAALDGAVRSLALELAPRVRVNGVCPGGVRTPMAVSHNARPQIPGPRGGPPPLGLGEPRTSPASSPSSSPPRPAGSPARPSSSTAG